jgi:hypothetical protein
MRDNSPWAYTHTIGFAANMISFNVLLFWSTILFVFWLAAFSGKKVVLSEPASVPETQTVPEFTPQPASRS